MNKQVGRGRRRSSASIYRIFWDVFVRSEAAAAASRLFNYRTRSDSRLDSVLIGVHGQI